MIRNSSKSRKIAFLRTLLLISLYGFAAHAFAGLSCEFHIINEWSTGGTAEITITNTGTEPEEVENILGTWGPATTVTNVWNGSVEGNNPYIFSGPAWNPILLPGQSISIGLQLSKKDGELEIPEFGGACATDGNQAPVIESFSCTSSTVVGDYFRLGLSVTVPSHFCTVEATDPEGDALSYTFDFGDDREPETNTSGGIYELTYVESGNYTVNATVSDGISETTGSQTIQAIGIGEAPQVNFTCTTDNENLTISCDASATTDPDGDNLIYAWDWSPDAVTHGVTSSHSYAAPGEYSVRLYVGDNYHINSLGKTYSFDANTAELEFNCQNTILYVDDFTHQLLGSQRLTACSVDYYNPQSEDTGAAQLQYFWQWGDGSTTEGGSTGNHAYVESGTYSITLTVEDPDSSLSTSATIDFDAIGNGLPPVLDVACTAEPGSLAVVCDASGSSDPEGDNINMTFTWGDGTMTTQAAEVETHTYPEAGTYTIKLLAMDSGPNSTGGHHVNESVEVTVPTGEVNSPPVADFNYEQDTVLCQTPPLVFDASTSYDPEGDPLDYLWTFPDGATATGVTVTRNIDGWPGDIVQVSLTVTDPSGASDTLVQDVVIPYPQPSPTPTPPPLHEVTADITSGTAPLTVNFTTTPSVGGWEYFNWTVEGERVAEGDLAMTHTFTEPGTYTVASDAGYRTSPCSVTSYRASITIEVLPAEPIGPYCEYAVVNDWGQGFVAEIRVHNDGGTPIQNWTASWEYTDGSEVTNIWNGTVVSEDPYTVTGAGWNNGVLPGQTVSVGVQGINGSGSAQVPEVTCTFN